MPIKSKPSPYTTTVPAVDQASKNLICLANASEYRLSLTEICARVGIYKSKGYAILNTLMSHGFIEKDPDTKGYYLGTGLLFLSRKALDNMNYRDISAPFLKTLALETGNTSFFGLISANQVFIVAKQESDHRFGVTIRMGHRFHISSGAHGKAIVAHMPKKEQMAILKRKRLYFYGDVSKFNRKRLSRELAECRKTGFAADMGDLSPGINALSSPVFGPNQHLLGAIVLMGTFDGDKIESFGSLITETAIQLSFQLGADINMLYPCLRK